MQRRPRLLEITIFFFFNDTATTEIYTLSLHDALPIWVSSSGLITKEDRHIGACVWIVGGSGSGKTSTTSLRLQERVDCRSEEHTSELQSQSNLVCRLLLEKKKANNTPHTLSTSHYALS